MASLNTMKRCFIIGISGVTNSGKTSVTSRLVKALPNCSMICQDDYKLPSDDPRVIIAPNGMKNFENLSGLDMDSLVSDVFAWINRNKESESSLQAFLVIEGFTIFNHCSLSKLCDKKYFIQVDKDTSHERRRKRVYDYADIPGYFAEIVWPMYLKNLKDIEDQKDIEYIDGMIELESLYQQIWNDIQQTFSLQP